MAQHPPMDVKTTVTGDAETRKALVRRFARLVSLVLIVICNAIVWSGYGPAGSTSMNWWRPPMCSTPSTIFVSGSPGSPSRERQSQYASARSGSIYPIRPARLISCNRRSSFGKGRTVGSIMSIRGSHADYRLLILVLGRCGSHCVRTRGEMVSGRAGIGVRLESAAGHGASLVH